MIETSQMQRLIISLGHPTYALSVVLFALLLSSGAGSHLTRNVAAEDLSTAGVRRMWLLVILLMGFGLLTPAIVRTSSSLSTPFRILAAVAVLFPAGLVMGMAFPLGMKLASRRSAALTPWLWGLNGAASVLASVLTICVALTWSISVAFWTGCAAYALALIAFRRSAATPDPVHAKTPPDHGPAAHAKPASVI
jgi:predicted membrane-bound spermidine synthase